MICCDCSEYMRNGDFHPSRFDGQSDAVGLISNAKTQQNHENTVGLIAMHPNARADVLVNCTQDIGRVLSSLAKMKIGDNSLIKPPTFITKNDEKTEQKINTKSDNDNDSINILVALQTAQLALKHRKNKKQDQRIILFVGSPVVKAQNEKLLIKAAKRLKKNNVSVDVVNFGETDTNSDLLERFIKAVAANDNSNLVNVPSGKLLSDVLVGTPIFSQSGQQINEFGNLGGNDADLNAAIAASRADAGGAPGFGGVDPNTDPELAMALRMSMEEERQRQETEAKKAAEEVEPQAQPQPQPPVQAAADSGNNNNNDAQPQAQAQGAASGDSGGGGGGVGGNLGNMAEELGIDEEDEELLKALQMSMEENNDDDDVDMNDNENENKDGDENFVEELLNDLPGINADDLDEIGNMEDLLAAVDDGDGDGDDKGGDNDKDKKGDKNDDKGDGNK
eukprot:802029_1